MPEAIDEFELRSIEVPVRTLILRSRMTRASGRRMPKGMSSPFSGGAVQTLERCRPTVMVAAQSRFTREDPERINAF
ncbi:MAG: hypothetical protein R3D28_20395 [Geminicoccaceae bacterium]